MIENAGVPSLSDAGARCGDAAARFAGDDDLLKSEVASSVVVSNLREVKSVGWCAHENGGLVVDQHSQAGHATQATGWNTKAAEPPRRFKRRPKTQKRAERKREKQAIVGRNAGDL